MPQVPEFTHGISDNVPGPQVNLGGAGALGQGLAQGAETAGNAINQTYNQVNEYEAQQSALTEHLKFEEDTANALNQVNKQSQGGYVTDSLGGFKTDHEGNRISTSQAFRDQADALYQNAQENLPNRAAQGYFRDRAERHIGVMLDRSINDEYQQKADYATTQNSIAFKQVTDDLINRDSSPQAIYDAMNKVGEIALARPELSGNEKAKWIEKARAKIVEAGVDAGINKISSAPPGQKLQYINQYLNFLDGKDGTDSFHQTGDKAFEQLDPKVREELRAKLLSVKSLAASGDVSDARLFLRDGIAIYRNANGDAAQLAAAKAKEGQYWAAMNRVMQAKSGAITPAQLQEDHAEWNSAKILGQLGAANVSPSPVELQNGQISQGMAYNALPPELRRQQFEEKVKSQIPAGAVQEATLKAGYTQLAATEKLEERKFSDYVTAFHGPSQTVSNFPWDDPSKINDVSGAWSEDQNVKHSLYIAHNKDASGHVDWSNYETIGQDNVRQLRDALTTTNPSSSNDAEIDHKNAMIKSLRQLDQSSPGSLNELMSQVVGEGKGSRGINPGWWLAANTENDQARRAIISGLVMPANKDSEVKLWVAQDANKTSIKEMRQAISSAQLGNINTILSEDPGGLQTKQKANDLLNAATDYGTRLMVEKGKSPQEAADQAGKVLIESQGNFRNDFVNGEGRYSVRLPVGTSKEDADAYREWAAQTLRDPKSLGLVIPPPPPHQGAPEQRAQYEKAWLDSVAKSGQIRATRDGQGFTLFVKNADQTRSRAQTTTDAHDPNSNLVFVSNQDALQAGHGYKGKVMSDVMDAIREHRAAPTGFGGGP